MGQNQPNPFNPNTRVPFSLGSTATVRLEVYDISGRLVRRIVDRVMVAGVYSETWDGRDMRGNEVANGLYFYRLMSGKEILTRKAVRLR